ncbi:protein ORF95 [Cyprinid herpesvirus 1]|uniref:Protein ORF95 n=1 Tax=Cyprinid herpesvirus 1 TaxID=317858 RepID=K7PC88_9VIRU|nr:protein ORF95 [Cyprinid herpesvirus 1]AFJ20392.1 protein ORF95 [Cyprinid herpesvirus 1]
MDFLTAFVCRYIREKCPEPEMVKLVDAIETFHYPSAGVTSDQIQSVLHSGYSSREELIIRVNSETNLFYLVLKNIGVSTIPPPRVNRDGQDNKRPFPVALPTLWFCSALMDSYEHMTGKRTKARKVVEEAANAFIIGDRAYNATKVTPPEASVLEARAKLDTFFTTFKVCFSHFLAIKSTPLQPAQAYGTTYVPLNDGTKGW